MKQDGGGADIRIREFLPNGLYFFSKAQGVGNAKKNHYGERTSFLAGTSNGFPGCLVAPW